MTIADAIDAGRPVMVVIATPVICVSRFCGPITDKVQRLAGIYGEDVEFVHLEVWQDFEAGIVNPSALEWIAPNNPSEGAEPWVFLVDETGTIANRWDNVASIAELEAGLAALLEPEPGTSGGPLIAATSPIASRAVDSDEGESGVETVTKDFHVVDGDDTVIALRLEHGLRSPQVGGDRTIHRRHPVRDTVNRVVDVFNKHRPGRCVVCGAGFVAELTDCLGRMRPIDFVQVRRILARCCGPHPDSGGGATTAPAASNHPYRRPAPAALASG